jgi:hypothetical protein
VTEFGICICMCCFALLRVTVNNKTRRGMLQQLSDFERFPPGPSCLVLCSAPRVVGGPLTAMHC